MARTASPMPPMNIIGPHLAIKGEVSSDDDLAIEGSVEGSVTVRDALLVIEGSGRVDADVRAPRVVVHGAVQGTIAASERLELSSSASVDGSLSANVIAMADGARFNGRVDMGRRTIAARVAQYRQSRSS
jgi:cytoskeletal protein CcmA (bactofilin family)